MSVQQQAQAAAECRENHEAGAGVVGDHADDLSGARPVIAERRDVWTTVVLAGTDGFSALWLTDDSAGLSAQGMIGSIGTPAEQRGRFALWFPGDELVDAARDGVEVEVTYRDGTTAISRLTL